MSNSTALYIHKYKSNPEQPLDLEQVWLDIKRLLLKLGANLNPLQESELLLNEKELLRHENSFHRFWGVAIGESTDFWGCGVYYEGLHGLKNPAPLFVSYSNDTIQVDEFLGFSVPSKENYLDLIKKMKQELLNEGKYEFSYNFDVGNDVTKLATHS